MDHSESYDYPHHKHLNLHIIYIISKDSLAAQKPNLRTSDLCPSNLKKKKKKGVMVIA